MFQLHIYTMTERRVGIISGYYNVPHKGHMEYARLAKEYLGSDGFLYCIVNNDQQAILKKGYSFMPEEDRVAIMGAVRYIDCAVLSIDTDRTVCQTIQMICDTCDPKPNFFINGGDVTATSKCPEEDVCRKNNIELIYGFGDKIQSSSWILEKSVKVTYEKMYSSK